MTEQATTRNYPPVVEHVLSGTGGLRQRVPRGRSCNEGHALPLIWASRGTGAGRLVVPPRVTDRDRAMLADLVRFGALLPSHLHRWHFASTTSLAAVWARLRKLERGGFVTRRRRGHQHESVYRVTRRGAKAAGIELTAPRSQGDAILGHTLTVAEVAAWLLAERFPGATWITERELRHASPAGPQPDGVLLTPDGCRLAVEVELCRKAPRLYRPKFAWYRQQHDYDLVLWLAPHASIVAALQRAITWAGVQATVEARRLPPSVPVHAST